MWLFTRDSYVSIVRYRTKPDHLLVRARTAEDITRLWPNATVEATPRADYQFRAAISEDDVATEVDKALRSIRYTTDFKGGVKEPSRHDAYLKVWQAMRGLSSGERRTPR